MINNQPYYYDDGIYYQPYNNGYQVVPAPISASVTGLPTGYSVVNVDDNTYYYYAGVFYTRTNSGYTVVDAPAGAVVYDLPEGATQLQAGDITYLQYNNTTYQPITIDGKDGYEVVQIDQQNQ